MNEELRRFARPRTAWRSDLAIIVLAIVTISALIGLLAQAGGLLVTTPVGAMLLEALNRFLQPFPTGLQLLLLLTAFAAFVIACAVGCVAVLVFLFERVTPTSPVSAVHCNANMPSAKNSLNRQKDGGPANA